MSLKDIFKNHPVKEEEPEPIPEVPNRIQGKIYYLHKNGYGFIESDVIPQERIYFHWKSLNHNTRKFAALVKGDIVEFSPRKYDEKKGWQALRVKVVEND